MMKTLARRPSFHRTLKNQSGFLTLDFIFATILMFAFSAILFVFSITFSAFEVAQYSIYASSRAYFAASKNENSQIEAGKAKFNELLRDRSSPLSNFFRNGWFQIYDVSLDNFNNEFSGDENMRTFVGARATIIAKILSIKIPILGGGVTNDLSASPSSYLMREPTHDECTDFTTSRLTEMQKVNGAFSNSFVGTAAYYPIADDGC